MTEPTQRELRDITQHALHRLATAPGYLASEETREKAHAALAQLTGRDREPGARDIYREHVQPGLWLALDASHCIVLEMRTADEAQLIGRVALSDCDRVTQAMENARVARADAEEKADAGRLAGLADAVRVPVTEQAGE